MENKEVLKHGGLFLYARNVFRLCTWKPLTEVLKRERLLYLYIYREGSVGEKVE